MKRGLQQAAALCKHCVPYVSLQRVGQACPFHTFTRTVILLDDLALLQRNLLLCGMMNFAGNISIIVFLL